MNDRYQPPFILRNPHLQTILNSLGPKRFLAQHIKGRLNSKHLNLCSTDGSQLLAELDVANNGNGSLVILLHGWEGSSQSCYQLTTAWHLLNLGFNVLRINLRDHGDSHHLNPGLFNSTLSPEVASAIANFLHHNRFATVFLAGYSLGGNFALRIAADSGKQLGLRAVAAICPPINPANAMAALNSGWRIYEGYFFRKWSRSLKRKLEHFPELGYGGELAKAGSLNDLNGFFIPRFTGFETPDAYYAAYSLTGNRLQNLDIPGYLIASADDPIIPVADLHYIDPNPCLHIDVQAHGGHCGFLTDLRGHSWVEKRLGEIFLGQLK